MTEQFKLKRRLINLRDILPPEFPEIVCLCGGTRFKKEFISENFRLTMEGKIVLSVGFFSHADAAIYTPTEEVEEKRAVDQLHFRKIDLSDRVHVINPTQLQCNVCESWFRVTSDGVIHPTCNCGIRPEGAYAIPRPYIGWSTQNEIDYAIQGGKIITYLEEH